MAQGTATDVGTGQASPIPVPETTAAVPLTFEGALLRIAALAWREQPTVEPESPDPPSWGRFEGELDVRMLNEGRKCELLAPYCFERPDGSKWPVPAGTVVDGASIPPPFWPLIGGPFEGKYRNASVIHDCYCDEESRPWRDTHRVFYEGMRCKGVSAAKAKIMYYAVYRFGPRWPDPGSPAEEAPQAMAPAIDPVSLAADAEAIYVHGLSLDEIERLADARNEAAKLAAGTPALESPGDPLAARARALVVCGGSGTPADLEAVASEAVHLPEQVVERFERKQIRIVACRGGVTDFEIDLKGQTPRGWESTGRTWDSVPGTYLEKKLRVVIATIADGAARKVPTKETRLHGSDSLVVHESLHGFDYSGGHAVLQDPDFIHARSADLPKLAHALNGYLVQESQPGLEETFAESGARFAVDRPAMTVDWPNLATYWTGEISGAQIAPESTPAMEGLAAEGEDVIGSATIETDGSIRLDLRAEGPSGAIGHGSFTIEEGDPHYQGLRDRLIGDTPIAEAAGPIRLPFTVTTPAGGPRRP